MFGSYHPPLSYLMARWIYAVYPHDLEVSQILSTLAMIGAVFSIRSTLRSTGVLHTLPGLVLLYVSASVPLIVWLGVETSYDPLVFFWFTLTLAISVRLLWRGAPPGWWRRPLYVARVLVLGVVLAAGLCTKFNALFHFGIPFCVILVRRGIRARPRSLAAVLVAVAIGIAVAAPLYYTRYYKPFGQLFPNAMDWLRANDLPTARQKRDANRWEFFLHMIRIPKEPMIGTQTAIHDSITNTVWLQIWKRDSYVGQQGQLSLLVSDVYLQVFPVLLVAASPLLFWRRGLPRRWRNLGWLLFLVGLAFVVALVYFGWKYPLWDWTVFKAKYVTPAALWGPYAVAAFTAALSARFARAPRLGRFATNGVLLVVIVFMFVNHLLPVY